MLLAETTLIPSFDMLGLPMPAWLAQSLNVLTLAMHWLFLSMTAGGAAGYLLLSSNKSAAVSEVRKAMAAFLPFTLTTAMTMGVAPLLFVQVLYGNYFYTSTILMGYVWMGLLVLMIANFYLLYWGWYRLKHDKPVRWVGLAVLLLMATSAAILTSNATLMQQPDAWRSFAEHMGTAPYMGDALFGARWSYAMFALAAGGGMFVATFMRSWSALYLQETAHGFTGALSLSAVGLAGMLGSGLWASLVMPAELKATLLGGSEGIFAYTTIGAIVLSLLLTLQAIRSPSGGRLTLAALALFVVLLGTASLRDALRRATMQAHLDLSAVAVHPQWGSFALFAVILVGGLGLVAYMVKLALSSPRPKQAI